jgi:hypothetical protein
MRCLGPFYFGELNPSGGWFAANPGLEMTTRIAGARCPKCSGTAFEILHSAQVDQAQFVCLKCEWRGSFTQIMQRRANGKSEEQ